MGRTDIDNSVGTCAGAIPWSSTCIEGICVPEIANSVGSEDRDIDVISRAA